MTILKQCITQELNDISPSSNQVQNRIPFEGAYKMNQFRSKFKNVWREHRDRRNEHSPRDANKGRDSRDENPKSEQECRPRTTLDGEE